MKGRWKVALTALASLALFVNVPPLRAQDAPPFSKQTTLWVDQKTGEVFVRPGRGREPMTFGVSAGQIEQEVEQRTQQRTQDAVRAAVAQTEAQQRYDHVELQKQVDQLKPAWNSYTSNFQNKFRIGALAYFDYSFYTHTGFGPQFLENMNPPGPYNNSYSSFDINRVYLNTYFTPTEELTFRFTPEIYRANGTATADKTGANTAFASNLDGDLNVRLKYAYVQYSGFFDKSPKFKGFTVTVGAQPNPLLGWEEDFTQYRFVYLSPWNYLGLSSSQIGLQVGGPIKFNGGEKDLYRLRRRHLRQRQVQPARTDRYQAGDGPGDVLSVRLGVALPGTRADGLLQLRLRQRRAGYRQRADLAQGEHLAFYANVRDSVLRRPGVEYSG
jgi:hypothetical protein